VGRDAVHRPVVLAGSAAQTVRRERAALALAVALLAGAIARPAAHDPITTKVTFAREIRAILAARCVTCHAPHGSAPMPLTTYDEVRPWARAIKEQVLDRRMPKWHAARGFGAFSNDPSLTPLESALVVSWVDGGLPRGGTVGTADVAVAPDRAVSAFRRESDRVLTLPPDVAGLSAPARVQWIAGWSFEPGDPRITSATISSAAGGIGTWVAGDQPVALAAGSALRVSGAVQITLRRRPAADFEAQSPVRPSLLRLRVAVPPAHQVWQEEVGCNVPRQAAGAPETTPATVLAVRPMLNAGASARIWLQRPGAPATIVGWFRDFEPAFSRTYWLARPLDLSPDSRLQSDSRCTIQLTLSR
jgi:hypothetical protein